MNSNLLTGIRDLDREIVNHMSDEDFLKMCTLNRTYYENVCNKDYFRIRTEKRYPETIPYKESAEGKARTWKNHYLTIVKYINLLHKEFSYNYIIEDKSPELLYLARQLLSTEIVYTKDVALITATEKGHLMVVKYLVDIGVDVNTENCHPLKSAVINSDFRIIKFLIENGARVTFDHNYVLYWAIMNGDSEIINYLTEHGAQSDDLIFE